MQGQIEPGEKGYLAWERRWSSSWICISLYVCMFMFVETSLGRSTCRVETLLLFSRLK